MRTSLDLFFSAPSWRLDMDIDIHVQRQPEQAKQFLSETTAVTHAVDVKSETKTAVHLSTQEPYAPSLGNGNIPPEESNPAVNTVNSGANLLTNGSQRSSSSLDPSSSCPSDISKELGFSTGNHATPNGSMTSMSLTSPLSQTKSSSPSTQLNNTLTTASARLGREAGVKPLPKVRPRSSIPSRIPATTYAQQCVIAAYSSRLNPYALHNGEQELLQDHLCHLHVTTYLNIRNGILRLWTRNPMLSVTEEEALGCAKDFRWMSLAAIAYDWLVRNGYINFGCVGVPKTVATPKRGRRKEGPTIVVVGAGMAGLGCARQLDSLFEQYCTNTFAPKIILLEGRKRIGGRIYSHPLQSIAPNELVPGLRSTAEMGAHIIVGFDHGNPLDPIIRAQLALRYHLLRDISTIYDVDGTPVNEIQDAMAEKLYNDILDRSGAYRHKAVMNSTAEGDRELIDSGRDSSSDDGVTIRQYEDAAASGTIGTLLPAKRLRKGVGHKTADIKPRVGPPLSELQPTQEHSAASACQAMGWKLKDGVSSSDSFSLDQIASAKNQTLGTVMDEGIKGYQKLLDLSPKDMRLLNWHFANLEYANAASVGKLSLSGWDQDMGNEFEGEHSQVVGGYQQLPRGLWSLPSKLDVRTNKAVSKVVYNASGTSSQKTRVHCEDGEVIHADKVIFTAPLGVLKQKSVEFDPPLPDWKTGAIERLGFGLLNKVILVFEKPFWDVERDMFGLLREPTAENSLSQDDYAPNRGQFYLFWNCMKTSGVPMLIALMAGDSAHKAESLSDAEILGGVTSQLRNVFKETAIPDPLETIITRWKSDRFAHGSYSYVAADALPGDYDLMARPIGNLYFAGEATCGTHPATVHGAYLSGLRAAREVMESVIGPIEVPTPLVPPKPKMPHITPNTTPSKTALKKSAQPSAKKRKLPQANNIEPAVLNRPAPAAASSTGSARSKESLQVAYEDTMWQVIFAELGMAEPSPRKLPLNPFLLYQKDYWFICKSKCDKARQTSTGKDDAKAPRDEVRQALGQMWRDASEEIRKPYLERIEGHRRANEENLAQWKERIAEWTRKTYEVKDRWCAENPFEGFVKSLLSPADGVEEGAAKKLKTGN